MGMKRTTLACCKCSRWRPDYYFFCHILTNCPFKHIMIILLQSQPRKSMEDWVFWHEWRLPTPLNEFNGPHEWQNDSCYTSWHVKNSNGCLFYTVGKKTCQAQARKSCQTNWFAGKVLETINLHSVNMTFMILIQTVSEILAPPRNGIKSYKINNT